MHAVVQHAAGLTDEVEKDPKAVERGRLGGKARAAKLTPDQRVQAAKVARAARKDS
jgi:hypothetical protein